LKRLVSALFLNVRRLHVANAKRYQDSAVLETRTFGCTLYLVRDISVQVNLDRSPDAFRNLNYKGDFPRMTIRCMALNNVARSLVKGQRSNQLSFRPCLKIKRKETESKDWPTSNWALLSRAEPVKFDTQKLVKSP